MKKWTILIAASIATLSAAENTNASEGQVAALGSRKSSAPLASSPQKKQMPMESGMPLSPGQSSPNILQRGRIQTAYDWDYQFKVSFNEYYATEEAIGIAYRSDGTDVNGAISVFDFGYHPGFELGFTLATPYDHWNLNADYLWFRSKSSASGSAATPAFLYSIFFTDNFANNLTSFRSNWDLSMDMADLNLSRPFYLGAKWTVEPLFGLRGGSIRQHIHLRAPTDLDTIQFAVLKSNSWAIGPRAGFQSNWLLGMGFSFFGDLSGSLLYTRYTSLSVKNSDTTGLQGIGSHNGYSILSTNVDTGLGVKWGSYFCCEKYYFDLSAAYNFSAYFSQNQMLTLNGVIGDVSGQSGGNLYLHGVSLSTSFMF